MISESSRYRQVPQSQRPLTESPVDPPQRYTETGTLRGTFQGRIIAYQKRRFLPQGLDIPALQQVTVTNGDRMDLIAYRSLGDSLQAWMICDANNAMNPWDLVTMPGRPLRIPIAQVETEMVWDEEPTT